MIVAQANDYPNFKAIFSNLGGNKKTPVLTFDDTVDNHFVIVASFIGDGISLHADVHTKPPTFDTDFPQAVSTDGLST